MPRIPLYIEAKADTTAAPVAGAVVTVRRRDDNTMVALYAAENGTTRLQNPIVTNSKGRAVAWTDPSDVNLQVTGTGITPYTIPYDGTPEFLDNSITTSKFPDKAVTPADLNVPVASIWRPIMTSSMSYGGQTVYAGQSFNQEGAANYPNSYSTKAQTTAYIDPAAYQVDGMTTNWRFDLVYAVNGFPAGGIYRVYCGRTTGVTSVSSEFGFGNMNFVLSVFTENIPYGIAHAYADTTGLLDGPGLYGFRVNQTPNPITANSRMNFTASLLVRWT